MARSASPSDPPFCPNHRCKSLAGTGTWRFKKKGFFHRAQRPKRVQRYLCLHCGRNFSSQTFSTRYWLRRGDLLEPVFHRLVSCSGFRQIAREFGVSHSTVRHLAERLGRHCLLFHEQLRAKSAPNEPLVLDGFRTFEHSQYWPMDLNLLVGVSHFVYGFNDAELRRSGTMRPAQRLRRSELEAEHGRPDPRATERSVTELLRRVVPRDSKALVRSDEHQAYPRAMKRLADRCFEHEATSSKQPRTTKNPLFPANLADGLLRHSSANHKRETIAFSKRRQGVLYRVAIWVVWRNYAKCTSENRRSPPPAVLLGITQRALTVTEVLARRIHPKHMKLSGWLRRCYFGEIETRAIRRCVAHRARLAC